MKILSVVGARPQFIKAHPVHLALKGRFTHTIVHTGQHYDLEMSKIFFDELGIPEPHYNLEVGSGPHGMQTGRMLQRVEKVLMEERPDAVVVYGDTNSTLAGALAAVKLHIPLAHVEAGLRSYDRRMPEEINRVVSDHLSTILFAPTKTAVDNLKKEGIEEGVYLVGDVMVDALYLHREVARRNGILRDLGLEEKNYLLVTVHRASNTDERERLVAIVDALIESGERVVFPVHPRTREAMKRYDLLERLEGAEEVEVIPPVGYIEFLRLIEGARKVLTDSGGVQKEAYILGVPCITLRDTTEWVETVKDGWNILVGAEKEKILKAIESFNPEGSRGEVFGDGKASERIADVLEDYLSRR
ncbi:MAG: UDP-N-acetylglucosamine 2-epimerase (non-hydrolyzing) [Thermoplasmata archaeon]|nr:MAG: UDP-N-acetylglucosamine 2-epimerase (non-hydrolyzing) [Thermoplasmata archaeon]RLF73367.1 MAG: UDP-N-acetylglucosamine 2-epimerase (non-hydrolyzing) [Thermoplasmata archaeon]RLF74473.1 MAG: UDP-N-acetylglucosamine 2-epimerase (non-hydrolyzing) [Thermoplasmata archaeon]HDD59672.1 UDP-N-acetylglucosamine 2-epimerase (non-hydrolyzing) [Euryarchaeota archaeon]